jgi:hypothetical protein
MRSTYFFVIKFKAIKKTYENYILKLKKYINICVFYMLRDT